MRNTKIQFSSEKVNQPTDDVLILSGNTQITNLLTILDNATINFGGTYANGYVLTSDASGNTYLQAPAVTQTELDGLKVNITVHSDTDNLVFSTPVIYINTNNDRNIVTVSGIATGNTGILIIEGTGSLSFSGLTNLVYSDILIKTNGYYIVKIFNASITSTPKYFIYNASSVSLSSGTTTNGLSGQTVISSSEILNLDTTPISILSSGSSIYAIDDAYVYIKYNGTPYSGDTTLRLSGNSEIGYVNCLNAVESGWYKFILNNNVLTKGNISVITTGTTLFGNSHVGIIYFYKKINENIFTFESNEVLYDDFDGTVINTTENFDITNTTPAKIAFSQNEVLRFDALTATSSVAEQDFILSKDSTDGECSFAIDWTALSDLTGINCRVGIWVDSANWVTLSAHPGGSALFTTKHAGTTETSQYAGAGAGSGARFRISINAANKIQYWRYDTEDWVEVDSANDKTWDLGPGRKVRMMTWSLGGAISYIEFDRLRFANVALYSEEVYNG